MVKIFKNNILCIHPTLSLSPFVYKSTLYICVSIAALLIGSSVPSLKKYVHIYVYIYTHINTCVKQTVGSCYVTQGAQPTALC